MGERVHIAVGALLLLVIAAPPADAEHCATGIAIQGRPAFTPGVLVPPTPRVCLAVETSGSTGHVLPPGTDEIFVRVQTDVGMSYPVLMLRLDGLGFRDQVYSVHRTMAPTGVWVYDISDWLSLPDPDAHGTLRATVHFPGNSEAIAEYTLLELPDLRSKPETDPSTLASEAGL